MLQIQKYQERKINTRSISGTTPPCVLQVIVLRLDHCGKNYLENNDIPTNQHLVSVQKQGKWNDVHIGCMPKHPHFGK